MMSGEDKQQATAMRVLVVEDEIITARDIENKLTGLGYEVSAIVSSGEEALRVVAQLSPGLVLMDIILEGNMDGIEAARQIKEQFDIPVVYLTAHSDIETLHRAKITEPHGYIVKPVTKRELTVVLSIALYNHKMETDKRRNLEHRYKRLLESITDYIYTVDVENGRPVKTTHGPGCAGVTGYTTEDYAADPYLWYEMIHEEDRGKALDYAEKALSGEYVQTFTHRIIHENGGIRWVSNTIVPNFDEHRRLIAYDGLVKDITAQRVLEEQLRQSQKMEGIGQLAGGIAHDFNNILTVMIGFTEVALMSLEPGHRVRPLLEEVVGAAHRAASLTHQLLAFSRKQALDMKPVNINSIIRNLNKLILRLIPEDIRFELALCPDLLTVLADSSQIDQILINLASNARDAMPLGGSLIIETGTTEIDEEFIKGHNFGSPGTYAFIRIRDTGTGIDAETQKKIFEPFFTTKQLGHGTGLGLAVVYGIIKQHKGYITVDSGPGPGAEFTLYLPLARAGVDVEKPGELPPPEGGSETILLADDDPAVRTVLSRILEDNGYDVIQAVDGEDAVDKFMENKYQIGLLVFDVIMPKKNGQDAYVAIKEKKQDIKALFLSGYTADMLQQKGITEAGCEVITKPVSPDDLLRKVREVLDNY